MLLRLALLCALIAALPCDAYAGIFRRGYRCQPRPTPRQEGPMQAPGKAYGPDLEDRVRALERQVFGR